MRISCQNCEISKKAEKQGRNYPKRKVGEWGSLKGLGGEDWLKIESAGVLKTLQKSGNRGDIKDGEIVKNRKCENA